MGSALSIPPVSDQLRCYNITDLGPAFPRSAPRPPPSQESLLSERSLFTHRNL